MTQRKQSALIDNSIMLHFDVMGQVMAGMILAVILKRAMGEEKPE